MKNVKTKMLSFLLVFAMLMTSGAFSEAVYAEEVCQDAIVNEADELTNKEIISSLAGKKTEGISVSVNEVSKRKEYSNCYYYDCTLTIHTVSPSGDDTVLNAENFSRAYTIYTRNNGSIFVGYGCDIESISGTTADNKVVLKLKDLITNLSEQGLSTIEIYYTPDIYEWIDISNPETYAYKETVSLAINEVGLSEGDFAENTLEEDHGLVVMFNPDDVSSTIDAPDSYQYAGDKIADSEGNYYYTGKQVKPNINVFDGNVRLIAGKDYKISYKNCTKPYVDEELSTKYGPGWSTHEKVKKSVKNPYALITGIGSYKGLTIAKFYNIIPAQIGYGYGIRAVATIKKSRIVPGNKPIAPAVTVTIQKWNEEKGKYFKCATLKQGRDYKVTYRKVGDTKEVESVTGDNICGEYYAVVSGVALSDNARNGGKLETAAQSMSRADYPADDNYKHLIGFVINNQDKDLTKAVISLKTGAESVAFEEVRQLRKDQMLDFWQIPSNNIEVSIGEQLLDATYYKAYVHDKKVGKDSSLMIQLTDAGKAAGYFASGGYVVLPSALTVTGKDISKFNLTNRLQVDDTIITGDTFEYVQKNEEVFYSPNYIVGEFILRNPDDPGEYLVSDMYNTGNYIVNFIKGSSGILGEGVYELVGNPDDGYYGSRKITVKIVSQGDGSITPNRYNFFLTEEREYGTAEVYADDDGLLKPEIPILYNKDIAKTGIDFKLKLFVNTKYRDLAKNTDYTIDYTTKNGSLTGDAEAVVKFIGQYEGLKDCKIAFKINPMNDESNIKATVGKLSIKGDITLNDLLAKAKYSIIEKSSGQKLTLDDDYVVDPVLYVGTEKTATTDMSANADPEKIYYMHFSGKAGSGYEGLSVYRALKFNRNLTARDFKKAFKNAQIAHKGDISYLERGDFLKDLTIEGLGEYGANKDFYFAPYKCDDHGDPDAAYYGSSGSKKVYLVGSEYTNKCSGSVLVTIKVDSIDKKLVNLEDGGYQYIRSLFIK